MNACKWTNVLFQLNFLAFQDNPRVFGSTSPSSNSSFVSVFQHHPRTAFALGRFSGYALHLLEKAACSRNQRENEERRKHTRGRKFSLFCN
jgi:hypothetical protein